MTSPLAPDVVSLPFAVPSGGVSVLPPVDAIDSTWNETPVFDSTSQQSIFALHLVNGEHYSGAERVQDLLARQLPQFGCEVGFACVKPQRFPNSRETKTAPLVEMPMRGRFDLRIVKRLVELVRTNDYDL